MKLALKVDVDTYRGTREGVPRLVEILERHGAGATFLFSLGPDHTGRAIRRVFRRGFVQKVARTSVLEHYGWRTLLYGTLLPAPDIGARCAAILAGVRSAGFEVGVHTWDHVAWQDGVAGADAGWTERLMRRACERFTAIFGERPRVHGAAGWQMNAHAYRLEPKLGFEYASDTRGREPFLPVCGSETISCPQLPTTLPTLDELIGRGGLAAGDVADHLLGLSRDPPASGHVFTLHAELEGGKLASAFERLLEGWKALGYRLVPLKTMAASVRSTALPRCRVVSGEIPGRSGRVALQAEPVGA